MRKSFILGKADVKLLPGYKHTENIDVFVYPETSRVEKGGTFVDVEGCHSGNIFTVRLSQINDISREERKLIDNAKKKKNGNGKKRKKTSTCHRRQML
ncbi:MAG: hypothetical protein K9M44_02080 [Candidatus Pacebacteria bacterium]|nr:hypothetical protein [Candidatus Paceibacterota bacterium]